MRKVLIASAVALVLFAVGAFAATFAVNSEDIASGSDDVVACAAQVDVDFTTPTYNAGANDWDVTAATLTFQDAAGANVTTCDGFRAEVQVENSGGTVVSSGSATVSGSTASVDLTPDTLVGLVFRASVLVDGKEITPLP